MKRRLWVLEEYVGDFDRCGPRNFIGLYKKRKDALVAKDEHLAEIDPSCIDGYCLTRLEVRRKGFQFVYCTEDLGK